MIHGSVQRAIPAPYALPVGFAMFLAMGTVAAGGRLVTQRQLLREVWGPA